MLPDNKIMLKIKYKKLNVLLYSFLKQNNSNHFYAKNFYKVN